MLASVLHAVVHVFSLFHCQWYGNDHHSRALFPNTSMDILKTAVFSMVNWITSDRPLFKSMTNMVHIDEKWYDMTRVKNTYYQLPGEAEPEHTMQIPTTLGKSCS